VTTDGRLQFWLLVWVVTAAYILVRHWRTGRGAGLVFTYVLSLAAIHWLAAAIYALPWYSTQEFDTTLDGLRVSAIALMAFGVGGEIGGLVFGRFGPALPNTVTPPRADPRIVNTYIVAGVIFYSVIFPIVAALPTASALASTSSSLVVLGVGLKAWNAWYQGRPSGTWLWLAATAAFPFVTLVGQGFLGFGFAAMLVVAAFVASFYRPRWQVVAAGALVAYLGLSIYVTYMRDRRDIREVVWGGESLDRASTTCCCSVTSRRRAPSAAAAPDRWSGSPSARQSWSSHRRPTRRTAVSWQRPAAPGSKETRFWSGPRQSAAAQCPQTA